MFGMRTHQPAITINDIPEAERSPTVRLLLSVIAFLESQLIRQSEQFDKQAEQLDALSSELKKLRKLQEKPKLKATYLLNPRAMST